MSNRHREDPANAAKAGVRMTSRGRGIGLACALALATGIRAADARIGGGCQGLDSCLSNLVAAAQAGEGISDTEQAATAAVLAFGEAAVPRLLSLLKDENPEVRDLVSYALRDAPVTEDHLDQLIESRLNGDGRIAPAIARIGTPRAIEFLVSELRKEAEAGTQLTWALGTLGEKGVPYVLKVFDCGPCDERVLVAVADVFSIWGDRAREAIVPLLAIAEDQQRGRIERQGAIRSLGSIGSMASPTVNRLRAIAARDPADFDEPVTRAMIAMGGAAADEGRERERQFQDGCLEKGSAEAARSRSALEALDRSIRDLKSREDLPQTVAALHSLLGSRCFRLAAEQGDPPEFEHPLSLVTWWEAGGRQWLASHIERPRLGVVTNLRDHVVLPPTPRRVLALETARGHALTPLLCGVADEACGRETRGWAERAQDAFSAIVLRDRTRDEGAYPVNDAALAARCESEMSAPTYGSWMRCLVEHRVPGWALPLGRFQSPDRGWFVVQGRRGHYDFCDELGIYDLDTGSAYVAKSCAGLHLRRDGSVDFDATDKKRDATIEVGRLEPANLREAVWMVLLAAQAEKVFLSADYFPIPGGLLPTTGRDDNRGSTEWGWSWNSGQTELRWSWQTADGTVLVTGTLTWPDSYSAPEAHAAKLLRLAEIGRKSDCPAAPLPTFAADTLGSGVSTRDARPRDLAALQQNLATVLREYVEPAACLPASRD